MRPRSIKGPVVAVGDSVLVDASSALRRAIPGVIVDAAVDRSALPGPSILSNYPQARSIVFALGANGGVTASLLARVMRVAAGRRVVLVTSHCPYCTYVSAENAVMQYGCDRKRNCAIADWNRLATAHPEWFARDGVHVGGPGARAFASLVRDRLAT